MQQSILHVADFTQMRSARVLLPPHINAASILHLKAADQAPIHGGPLPGQSMSNAIAIFLMKHELSIGIPFIVIAMLPAIRDSVFKVANTVIVKQPCSDQTLAHKIPAQQLLPVLVRLLHALDGFCRD